MNGRPSPGFLETIRKRPGMVVGVANSYGIRYLLKSIIAGYLEDVAGISAIEITFNPDNHISIVISGVSLDELLHEVAFLEEITSAKNYKTGILIGLTNTLLVRIIADTDMHILASHAGVYDITTRPVAGEANGIKLDFQLEPSIFKAYEANYQSVNKVLQQFASLNAGLKIISVDNRGDLQRNVFYFRNGLADIFHYLLEKHEYSKRNSWLPLDIRTAINGYIYHILIRYHHIHSSYPEPYIRSFANNEPTLQHGSLVDGILKGLADAFEATGIAADADLKVTKKRIGKQLVLFASVKGEPLNRSASSKEELDMPEIKKDIRKYVRKSVMKHLENHPKDKKRMIEKFRRDEEEN